jgi:hypothetical protein
MQAETQLGVTGLPERAAANCKAVCIMSQIDRAKPRAAASQLTFRAGTLTLLCLVI